MNFPGQELQESQSTVNQLTVKNQELQDNSHPSIIPSSFGMPCRDSSPQPGNVFENPSASDELTASCSGNVYARSPTATQWLTYKFTWLNNRGIRSRKCISITSPYLRRSSVGRRVSKQKCVSVLVTLRKLCVRSKKWRWSIRWTISRRPSEFEEIDSRILRCWMLSEEHHPEFKLQEKSQSGRAKDTN